MRTRSAGAGEVRPGAQGQRSGTRSSAATSFVGLVAVGVAAALAVVTALASRLGRQGVRAEVGGNCGPICVWTVFGNFGTSPWRELRTLLASFGGVGKKRTLLASVSVGKHTNLKTLHDAAMLPPHPQHACT